MLEAIIVTLPKLERILSHRTLGLLLLNVDLKMYARLMANRLLHFILSLVKSDQVGFVPGCQAPDDTHRILNLLHQVGSTKRHFLLLTLDVEKAIHRVHWGYLSQVLHTFGLHEVGIPTGDKFGNYSPIYCTTPSVHAYGEGLFSKTFTITNGTGQVCPLFPLIIVLAREPLA